MSTGRITSQQAGDALEAAAPIITALIRQHLPGITSHDEEDLRQDITLRILEVLHLYDPTKGLLTTWLFVIARNIIIDFSREREHHNKTKDIASVDVAAPEPAGAANPMPDLIHLTDKQRLIYERLLQGHRQTAIAKDLGVTREAVARLKRRMLDRLQTFTRAA